jgi:streptogramin lyase
MNGKVWLSSILGAFGVALALFGTQRAVSGKNFGAKAEASPIAGMGTLSGTVKAPKEFKAAQVYAKNVDKNVIYMVYTANGRYRAVNLFLGNYEVSVKKNGFSGDVKKVVITAGGAATADFTLWESPPEALLGVHDRVDNLGVKQVSYDELYPPGPGRPLIEKTCMLCHGRDFVPSHQWDSSQWNAAIDLMSDPTALVPGRIVPGTFNPKDRENLVAYLVKNYGPDSVKRGLEVPEMPVDERALANAMYVEYYVPQEYGRPMHDEHFDQEGNVWIVERTPGRPSIDKLDPRTGTWKGYPIPDPNALPHGITLDSEGDMWFAGETAFGRVDPKTGEMKLDYFDDKNTKRQSHGHTPVVDSKGNVWMTLSYTNELAKWDRTTGEISRWKTPTPYSFPYGVVVDKNDKLWMAEWFRCKVAKFDPAAKQVIEYSPLTSPCTMRRLSVDHKGMVWYALDGNGIVGKLDPNTSKIVEYVIPVKYSFPYDIQPDHEDNLWISDAGQGGALIKLDQQTKKFTYYPSIQRTDMPKLEITREGAIWYTARSAQGQAVGVLYPDITEIKTMGAYY